MVVVRQLQLVEIVDAVPVRRPDDQVARRIGDAHHLDDLGQDPVPGVAVEIAVRFVEQLEDHRVGLVAVAARHLAPGGAQQDGAVFRLGVGAVLEIVIVEDDVQLMFLGLGNHPVELGEPLRIDRAVGAKMIVGLAENEHVQPQGRKAGGLDPGEGIVRIVAGLAVLPVGIIAQDIDAGAHLGGLRGGVDRHKLGGGVIGRRGILGLRGAYGQPTRQNNR